MSKITENLKKKIYDTYLIDGISAAHNLAERELNFINYRFCDECAEDVPVIRGEIDCIICGQDTKYIKTDDFVPLNREP